MKDSIVVSTDSLNDEPISLAELSAHEERFTFGRFTNDDAWDLGVALLQAARRRDAAVTVDISRGDQQLFHAALPGTAPDNDVWLARKSRVVKRFGHSSLYMGQLCRDESTTLEEKFALPPDEFAAHGGAFPVRVNDVGVVGVLAVSGLPEILDHRLVVETLAEYLQL